MHMEELEKKLIEGNSKFQKKLQLGLDTHISNEKIPNYPVLILTCMDPRIDVHRIFQLKPGDLFILRNAGNILTKDMLRSILIAISEFNVENIIVLGHLDCGMTKLKLNEFKTKLGMNLTQSELRKFFQPFIDELMNIASQVQTLKENRIISSKAEIMGMLYDINTGYVFESEIIKKFRFVKDFHKNYLELIERKKTISNNDILLARGTSDLKEEPKNQIIEQANNELFKNAQENRTIEKTNTELLDNQSENDFYKLIQANVSIMRLPKIYIPKIKIHVPQIYKKKSQK